MHSLVIASAFALDLVLGDPAWFPHPVRFIGRMIQLDEKGLRKLFKSPGAEKIAGVLLVLLIVPTVYFLTRLLLSYTSGISAFFGFLVSVVTAYTTLAARSLGDAAGSVLARLEAGDIDGARMELSMIVGRDMKNLDEHEIARAAIETVAENASDGVVAPLFYLVIGGPALAMAYKAVNTLDSMVGYRSEKYINFGRAAARLDDIVNYIPARVTAVLICLAAEIQRRLKPETTPHPFAFAQDVLNLLPGGERAGVRGDSALNTPPARVLSLSEPGRAQSAFASSWRIMLRDGRNHPSPNSGYPEAAMAGALGIRLGGPSTYGGEISRKPVIGNEGDLPGKKDIANSIRLLYCSTLLAVLGAAALNFFLTKIVRVI